jgi:hypothetical protein
MYNIGDKILCINDTIQPHALEESLRDIPNFVKKGDKYTIRSFNNNDGIVVGVLLEEIRNPILFFSLLGRSQEGGFALWRFTKCQEDKIKIKEEVYEDSVY